MGPLGRGEPRGGRSLRGPRAHREAGLSVLATGTRRGACRPWSGFEVKSMGQVGGNGTINAAGRFPPALSPATTYESRHFL